MQSITVQIKNNYGQEAIYPMDDAGRAFAQIAGTRTLTRSTLTLVKELGYEVKVAQAAL